MKMTCLFMSMFAIAALASCNNEDEVLDNGTQGEKASSWIGITVKLPGSTETRAADAIDGNAEALETEIKAIKLYYQKEDGTVDAIETTFAAGDFDKGVAKKAAKVPVAVGTKVTVYAAINAPASPVFSPNWFNFRGTPVEPSINYWTVESKALCNAATGFTMTGKGEATTFATDNPADLTGKSHSSISLERTVAKVLVSASFDPTADFAENNVNGSSGNFQKNSLTWIIGNDNKKIFLLGDATNKKDPNWEELATGITDATLDNEYDNRSPLSTSYTMSVPKSTDVTATGYKTDGTVCVQYCNENTNEVYQYGNTSFISVKAVFVPTKIVENVTVGGGGDLVMDAVQNNNGVATFYYYSAGLKYLTATARDEAIATGKITAADFMGPYTNGECYYFVPIKDKDGKIGVLRNSYYTMSIKSLKAPGQPTPKSNELVKPVEQTSWIAVDFTVTDWNSHNMGDLDLE